MDGLAHLAACSEDDKEKVAFVVNRFGVFLQYWLHGKGHTDCDLHELVTLVCAQ